MQSAPLCETLPVPQTDRQTDRHTHTQDNYRNPPAHARRGLIIITDTTETAPIKFAFATHRLDYNVVQEYERSYAAVSCVDTLV